MSDVGLSRGKGKVFQPVTPFANYVDGRNQPTATMSQSYKSLKEDFVSNLSGGSIGEINYVTAVAPVGLVQAMEWLLLI